MSQEIVDRVLASPALPSMPGVALRVVELTQQEDVSVNEIVGVIRNDPALTAKLLQTANSPLFGLSRKVGSLEQATVILGLRSVKVMALSFSLVTAMQKSQVSDFDYKRYWRRSMTTAVAAKLFAQEHKVVRQDECFVGGLLTDIGLLAARQCVPELYGPVLAQFAAAPRPIQEIEAEMLGVTHPHISAAMLRKWSLPDMLCDAMAAHHGEGLRALPERTRMIAEVLYAASLVGELFCGDVDGGKLDDIKARCLSLIPMPPENLEKILDELQSNVSQMASLFQVEIGEGISYEDLRTQATLLLATISISAEMERAQATSRADAVQLKLEEVNQRASTDGLTQVANRLAFDEHLASVRARAIEAGESLGLIMIDIDHFKRLNDTYGHQAGDEALRQVGRCLMRRCADPAFPARYGGEEFAVVVTGPSERALRELAEEVRREIGRIYFVFGRDPVTFTASLGAVHVDLGADRSTPAEIIERADMCLYEAKRSGRNRVVIAA